VMDAGAITIAVSTMRTFKYGNRIIKLQYSTLVSRQYASARLRLAIFLPMPRASQFNRKFRILDLRCRNRPISKFWIAPSQPCLFSSVSYVVPMTWLMGCPA
jgi:hypothetical protein